MRDIDFLKYEEGAPVEYDQSKKGYFLSDKTWNLPPVQVSRKEVFSFAIARKLLERFRGTPLEMDMQSVLNKIAESLEGSVTLDAGMTEHFTVLGEDYVRLDPAVWKKVAGLVERREAMKAYYQKFNGQCGWYELEPYHLISYHGNWYVLARERREDKSSTLSAPQNAVAEAGAPPGVSQKRGVWKGGPAASRAVRLPSAQASKSEKGTENQIKTFVISRMRKVLGMGRHFEMPPGFRVKDHVEAAFGIVRGDEVMDVRLVFAPTVAAYIRERAWHPSQKIIVRRDGGIELRLKTAGWKELVRWILSWQPDVKVLAPKKLRERVVEKMREGVRGGEEKDEG